MTEDEVFLSHILNCQPIDLALKKPVLSPHQQKLFEEYKQRRTNNEPLQYILGTCNFMGLELEVDPSVLVPRPETEQLVDHALKCFKVGRALDLGTGSGNIAIALAKFVPSSQIISVDISLQALGLAQRNAKRHKVEDRIRFINDDFLMPLCRIDARYDLIISNPPYIPTGQLSALPRDVQKEPVRALDGGEDGLKYSRIIIKYSPYLLREGACLMMEFGDGQAQALKKLIKTQRLFSGVEVIRDLAGRERIIKAIR